jgi:hypothetical protein
MYFKGLMRSLDFAGPFPKRLPCNFACQGGRDSWTY